jgi:outer membrane protein OmpA-like peptidoglycan-associated protein
MGAAVWAVPCLSGLLVGCSGGPSLNPVNWWHSLEGGKIAEQRPPPPGADQPYPNLASVPAKPTPPDQDAMKKLTEALVADRANARYSAEAAPLPDPSSPSASPGLFGVGAVPPPPPPGQPAASASLPAVSAPPAPVAPTLPATPAASPSAAAPTAPPPARAPVKAVQSAPLTAPAPPPVAGQAPAPPAMAQTAPAQPGAAQPGIAQPGAAPPGAAQPEPPQPPLPTGAPPPAAVTGGPPPPPPPLAPSPMPTPVGGASTSLEFARGSAALSPETSAAVKQFAASHAGASILVTGYGDAEASDPAAQTVALSLGLSRAQAVANALAADGVPAAAVRVSAEASGRGVALRLLH